jgi:formylglycine-generating enzyme required for sulfatase activity
MTPERRRQVEELYRDALEHSAPDRLAWVAERCSGDLELKFAVEALLAHTKDTQLREPVNDEHRDAVRIEPGVSIGSYRIGTFLGKGGMGVVYRATDTRLNRPVAIKFLSSTLLDASGARRFQREAQLASALNHPHIVTVHDVGDYAGSQFLVTELVDGGTLEEWRRMEPRTWRQVAELLIGVADALATAHAANILHRDVKPGNILVSSSGYAKLADFGLAKSVHEGAAYRGATESWTGAGAIIGTPAYMSPEQISGRVLDARSDVFAFGVVLYEMLTNRQPFDGPTELDLMHAVVHAEPTALPAELPGALRTIVAKAIEKDPAERYQSMRDLVVDLKRVARKSEAGVTPAERTSATDPIEVATSVSRVPAPAHGSRRSWIMTVGTAIAVIGLLAGSFLGWQRMQRVTLAHAAVAEIAKLTDAGDYPAAFARTQEVRRIIPDDSLLNSLMPLFTTVYAITSTPSGADVFARGYDDLKGEWQHMGRTPLTRVELPRRAMRWRIEKAGFETVERANTALGYRSGIGKYLTQDAGQLNVTMSAVGEQPADMVLVPGGSTAFILDRLPPQQVPAFLVDRNEVTNAEYKEFVQAGGYERRSWWEGFDIRRDGESLPFDAAMRLFVDATDRAGPAGWELGSYPEGKGSFPVAGISWYEAMAYARYRGKSLPTLYHWAHAASLADGSLAASTAPLSNLGTSGSAPVGQFQGLGPYGTSDLFGNVREWILNTGPTGGWVVGGSWEDPWYSYAATAPAALLERSSLNGFRLVQNLNEPTNGPALRATLDLATRGRADLASLTPVSDETFATFLPQLAYSPGPLDATAPATMATTEDWIKQRVTINTYDQERMDVILFVPRRARPPFQPVILFSGSQVFMFPGTVDSLEPGFAALPVDYIVKSGRMIVQPVFQGSFERLKTPIDHGDPVRITRNLIEWRWDLGRTLDYLATRPDVDAERVGYVGLSLGGQTAVGLLAVESRIKAAVLLSGGLRDDPGRTPFLDMVNYAPRVRIPVLMVNGRYDEYNPVESSQLPLFGLLGSAPGQKQHVILESGHGSPPRNEALKETLGWYDKYLGPVNP